MVSAVFEGRVRLGGGPQDFQCLNKIGNKIQVNFWTKVERSKGDSNLLTCLECEAHPGCLKEGKNSS